MKTIRKLLALLLCLTLCLTLMPAAFAEEAGDGEPFVWEDVPEAEPEAPAPGEELPFVFETAPAAEAPEGDVPPDADTPELPAPAESPEPEAEANADSVALTGRNFPDASLRDYLSHYYDQDEDGVLDADEISRVKSITCEPGNLVGIGYFPNLEHLDISYGTLSSMDLSRNSKLKELYCRNCTNLTELELSANTLLAYLQCSYCPITELNIGTLRNMKELSCNECGMTTLNITQCTALERLECGGNNLTALSLRLNGALRTLYCPDNAIKSLDLSRCQQLQHVYVENNELTALNLESQTALKTLDCSGNPLTSLDVSCCPALGEFYCEDLEQLASLDLSGNPALFALGCSGCTGLSALDLSHNPEMDRLYCSGCGLSSLSVRQNPKLRVLSAYNNSLKSLNLSSNTALQILDVHSNQLTGLDLSNNTALEDLSVHCNKLTSLNVLSIPLLVKAIQQGTRSVSGSGYLEFKYSGDRESAFVSVDSDVALNPPDPALTKPVITVQPKSVTAADGEETQFTLKASGTGLKYQWQFSTDGGKTWKDNTSSGCKTDTMTFTARAAYSGRKYHCIVSNAAGPVTSKAVTLTVTSGKPVITTEPQDITVKDGEPVQFTLKASGAGLSYQWQYQLPGRTEWNDNTSSGYDTDTLSFSAREIYSGRKYHCVVTNAAGSTTSKDVTLTVTPASKKPTISTQPKSASIVSGQKVTFSLKASGTGLKYQWQYQLPGKSAWNNNSSAGYNTSTMSFTAREIYSGRKYRCLVSNAAGTTTSAAVSLTVIVKPTITTQPKSVSTTAGKSVTLSVKATGGALKYQWQYQLPGKTAWNNNTSTGYNTASMTFTARASYSGRKYRCIVTNAAGQVTSSVVTLTVQ